MAVTTYFVVQPFDFSGKGRLVAGQPIQTQSGDHAKRLAERHATQKAGAIAFSRTGDPAFGDFEDAVILGKFGQVPEEI